MATEREKIFPGDTLPVSYECRLPDPADNRNTYGLPAEPSDAFARLKDQDDVFLELGGPGSITGPVEIIPPTGTTSRDTGALLNYTVNEDFTQEPGDYTLYITAIYPNGTVRTEDRRFKILEML
jgi:hypothetical protein